MELRKDYITDRYVIISESRASRPNDFHNADEENPSAGCFFCPGSESMTPPEIGRIGQPWRIRWFSNKFSALAPQGKFEINTDNKYFTYSDAYGYHEVIVETNNHAVQLADLSDGELKEVLDVYKSRITELSARPHIKYVLVFKNHGSRAGTSIRHSHTQIAALNSIPGTIREKLAAVKSYDSCPYCEIINIEKGSYRRCFENRSFVAFTPYASRYNYELWIFPKKHYLSMTELDDIETSELAQILRQALSRLKQLNASYNMFIHNSPQDMLGKPGGMHFHLEITPRISTFGGLEIGSDVVINCVSPENAASFYRGDGGKT